MDTRSELLNSVRIYIYKEFPEFTLIQVFIELINSTVHVCVGPKDMANDILKKSSTINGKKILISLYLDNDYKLTTGHRNKIDNFFKEVKKLKLNKTNNKR